MCAGVERNCRCDRLGTNLLTSATARAFTGATVELPIVAPPMIGRISGVQQVQSTGKLAGVGALRNPFIPAVDTNGLTVEAASLDLLRVIATTLADGLPQRRHRT